MRQRTFSRRQAVILGVTHALAIAALPIASLRGAIALAIAYVATGYGISLGYHRGLSHGAFRASKTASCVLALLGTLAFQGGPITWVGLHRAHHRFTDAHGDPHAATRGFFWSHVGWALHKGPNGYRRQKLGHLTAGLERDSFLAWLERWHLALNVALFAVVFVLAGAGVALWAFPLRVVFLWHVTWLTNSIAHGVLPHASPSGPKPAPRNLPWLAMIGFGEGLHKNHHDAPSLASFARKPGEVDPGYWGLSLLAKLRVVEIPRRASA